MEAPLFCDASGDGIVAFLAGAAFRMGAKSRDEFDEGFAPEQSTDELLGHSLYFYSKDTGRPVRFVAPAFALKDITPSPVIGDIRASDSGCRFWWLEWGGRSGHRFTTPKRSSGNCGGLPTASGTTSRIRAVSRS